MERSRGKENKGEAKETEGSADKGGGAEKMERKASNRERG